MGIAIRCALGLVLSALCTLTVAQEWQLTNFLNVTPTGASGVNRPTVVDLVSLTGNDHSRLSYQVRSPRNNADICGMRPRSASATAYGDRQVVTVAPAMVGCSQTRLVILPNGTGWEEEATSAGWKRTGATLTGPAFISALYGVPPERSDPTIQTEDSVPLATVQRLPEQASRLREIMLAGQRYVARANGWEIHFTADEGELLKVDHSYLPIGVPSGGGTGVRLQCGRGLSVSRTGEISGSCTALPGGYSYTASGKFPHLLLRTSQWLFAAPPLDLVALPASPSGDRRGDTQASAPAVTPPSAVAATLVDVSPVPAPTPPRNQEVVQVTALTQPATQQQPQPALTRPSVRALVIGNSDYQHFGRLRNPQNDAAAMAAKLRSFGIDVHLLVNADREAFVRGLNEFADRATGSDINIVFYAGHGVQIDGTNYLIPTAMRSDNVSAGYVKLSAISLNAVLDYLPARTRLVFLDACRDNPLARSLVASRSASGVGLAPVSVSSGTLIAYATKDGATADDGNGQNSPYTTALLQHLDSQNDIAIVLRQVRQTVLRLTSNKQEPWEYGSLLGDTLVLSTAAKR